MKILMFAEVSDNFCSAVRNLAVIKLNQNLEPYVVAANVYRDGDMFVWNSGDYCSDFQEAYASFCNRFEACMA